MKASVLFAAALLFLGAGFVGYLAVDLRYIQPWLHAKRTLKADASNDQLWAKSDVKIYQVSVMSAEDDGRKLMWSELACASKQITAQRTFKSPGQNLLAHFSMNDPVLQYQTSQNGTYRIVINGDAACNFIAQEIRDLPIALKTHLYKGQAMSDQVPGPYCAGPAAPSAGAAAAVVFVTGLRMRPLNTFLTRVAYGKADRTWDWTGWRPTQFNKDALGDLASNRC